ncbi:MAG: hypothetical protein WKF34_03000 [Pyrinomonadaceae bacterium]
MKHNFFRYLFVICALVFAFGESAMAQAGEAAQMFRGTLIEHLIEMSLIFDNNNKVTGNYQYVGATGQLTLKGRREGDRLTLDEFDPGGKRTGSFRCDIKADAEEKTKTLECLWSKPASKAEYSATLTEQHIEFSGALQIVTKTIAEKRLGILAAYPQIIGGNTQAVTAFNRRAAALAAKAVSDYKKDYEPGPKRSYFSLDYNISLATDDLISVEFSKQSFAGGAYPDSEYDDLNFNLSGAGREIKIEELFVPKSKFEGAIQTFSLKSINQGLETDSKLPADMVAGFDKWTMTRHGIIVYYDFPHVIAALSRVFVPYSVVRSDLSKNGPARFAIKP